VPAGISADQRRRERGPLRRLERAKLISTAEANAAHEDLMLFMCA
jgi:hypothetical protein